MQDKAAGRAFSSDQLPTLTIILSDGPDVPIETARINRTQGRTSRLPPGLLVSRRHLAATPYETQPVGESFQAFNDVFGLLFGSQRLRPGRAEREPTLGWLTLPEDIKLTVMSARHRVHGVADDTPADRGVIFFTSVRESGRRTDPGEIPARKAATTPTASQ